MENKYYTTDKSELLNFDKFRDTFIRRFGKENIEKIEKVANSLNNENIKEIYSVKILQYWDREDFNDIKKRLLNIL